MFDTLRIKSTYAHRYYEKKNECLRKNILFFMR